MVNTSRSPERPHHLDLAREAPGQVQIAPGLLVLSADLRVDDLASSLRGEVDDPVVTPGHESATQLFQVVDRLVAGLHAGDDRRVPHHVADLVVHAQRLWIGVVDIDRLQAPYSRLTGAVADDQVGAADLGRPRDQAGATAGPYNRLAATDRVPQALDDLASFEPLLHCIRSFVRITGIQRSPSSYWYALAMPCSDSGGCSLIRGSAIALLQPDFTVDPGRALDLESATERLNTAKGRSSLMQYQSRSADISYILTIIYMFLLNVLQRLFRGYRTSQHQFDVVHNGFVNRYRKTSCPEIRSR